MKEIGPAELRHMNEVAEAFQLIDVREPYEVEVCNIGGTSIPMGQIVERRNEIRTDIPVVVHCKSGNRSRAVIDALSCRYGFTNLINLTGGIEAYRDQVEPALNCE